MPSEKQQYQIKKVLHFVLLFFVFSFSLLASSAHAVGLPTLLPDCDPIPTSSNPCQPKHLVQLVINIYNLMLYFAAFITLLFIIWGGFRMLWFSYWEESEAELAAAKLTVSRAITGLVVVISAFLIVNTAVLFLTGKDVNELLNEFGVL